MTAPAPPPDPTLCHASTVAWNGRGVMILGPSGAGKSALALELMAYGAGLVADDQTVVTHRQGALWADAPAAIKGRIEARGVGILAADAVGPVRLALVVDLGAPVPPRLPEKQTYRLLSVTLPLVSGPFRAHLGPAIVQYLRRGRVD